VIEMSIAAGGAGALINALASKKTAATVAGLNNTVSGLNNLNEAGGLQTLNSVINAAGQASLVMAPIQSALAQIQSQTTQAGIGLMNQMFEALQSPAGQATIVAVSGMFTTVIENASTLVNLINVTTNFFNALPGFTKIMEDLQGSTNLAEAAAKNFSTSLLTEFGKALDDGVITMEEKAMLLPKALEGIGLDITNEYLKIGEEMASGQSTLLEGVKDVFTALKDALWKNIVESALATQNKTLDSLTVNLDEAAEVVKIKIEIKMWEIFEKILSVMQATLTDEEMARIDALNARLKELTTTAGDAATAFQEAQDDLQGWIAKMEGNDGTGGQ